jgi:hypothetical protein
MDKQNEIFHVVEYYSSIKSDNVLACASKWINLEYVLSEINHLSKDISCESLFI